MPTERAQSQERRRHSRLPYALALLVMGALIVVAWLAQGTFRPVVAGEPAPDFQVTNLAGEPVHLSDYRGKVVLLNVWATWCGNALAGSGLTKPCTPGAWPLGDSAPRLPPT